MSAAPAAADAARLARVGRWLGPAAAAAVALLPLPLEGTERAAAAVTTLTAVWWLTEAVPIAAASLVPAALLPLTGVLTAGQAAEAYWNDLIFLFLGAFVLALGVERWGVHRRVALWVVAQVGARPHRIVLGFMLAAGFLSMWLNNTATTLMMLPIGVAVVQAVEGEREDETGHSPFGLALLLGLAYAASVGGVGTPVGTAPNQVFLGQFADRFPEGPEFSFGEWLLAFGPLVFLFVPIAWWLLTRVVLRVPNQSKVGGDVIAAQRRALGPWTTPQLRMATLFGLTALLWVTRSDLDVGVVRVPGWVRLWLPADAGPEGYAAAVRQVSNATIAVGMAVLAFVVPAGGGQRGALVDWPTAVRLPWDVLLLLGGGFCIAAGFQASGLDARLGEAIAPALGTLPTPLLVLVVAASVAFLTEITSNTATTQVLLPVLAAAAAAAGIHPAIAMLPATIAASCAFALPVATPPNAVVFASHRVTIPEMAKVGIWMNVLAILLITALFELWVRPVLGIGVELPDWAR